MPWQRWDSLVARFRLVCTIRAQLKCLCSDTTTTLWCQAREYHKRSWRNHCPSISSSGTLQHWDSGQHLKTSQRSGYWTGLWDGSNPLHGSGRDRMEYEADPRHAELFIHQLGLSCSSRSVKWEVQNLELITARARQTMTTLCIDQPRWDCVILRWTDLICNFHQQSRQIFDWTRTVDPGVSATNWETVSRCGVHWLKSHSLPEKRQKYIIHMPRATSTTQGVTAWCSGESEFYALVKGTQTGLGAVSMLKDLGVDIRKQSGAWSENWFDRWRRHSSTVRRGAGKHTRRQRKNLWKSLEVRNRQISEPNILTTDQFKEHWRGAWIRESTSWGVHFRWCRKHKWNLDSIDSGSTDSVKQKQLRDQMM